MKEENILDREILEVENKIVYKFQIIEFILIGLFCSLLFSEQYFTASKLRSIILIFLLSILIFSAIRIYFEYKNELITGFGIVLKIYLLLNTVVILTGFLFKIMNWENSQEMLTISLLSLSYTYLFYAITLKSISIQTKAVLFLNSLVTGIFVMGILYKLESWSNGQHLVIIGFILTLISLPILGLMLRKNLSKKERYHSINYIGRSIAILFFGVQYLL